MRTAILVVLLVLTVTATTFAGSVWEPFVAFDVTRETEKILSVSAPQMALYYKAQCVRQWDQMMGEFLKNLPTGDALGDRGPELTIWPNANAENQEVMAVYYAMHELTGSVRFDQMMNPEPGSGLRRAYRDASSDRFEIRIDLNRFPGPQRVWLYAMIRDGESRTTRFLCFKWCKNKNPNQVIGSLGYTTARWVDENPDAKVLARALDNAGCGGSNPFVYREMEPQAPTAVVTQNDSFPTTRLAEAEKVEANDESLANGVATNADNIGEVTDTTNGLIDTSGALATGLGDTRTEVNRQGTALAKHVEDDVAMGKAQNETDKAQNGRLDGLTDTTNGLIDTSGALATGLGDTRTEVNRQGTALAKHVEDDVAMGKAQNETDKAQNGNIEELRKELDASKQRIAQLEADRDATQAWAIAASEPTTTTVSSSQDELEPFMVMWMKGDAVYDGSIFLSTDGKLYKTPSVSTWVLPDGSSVQFDWSLDRQQWTSYHGVARRGAVVRIDVKNREVR